MLATLDHTAPVAQNIQTFYIKPQRPLRYIAGQFIELYLPHANADTRGEKHWFTLSSSPTEELLAITTIFSTGRSSTFKQTLRSLRSGDTVAISEPMGDFVLPKDPQVPLFFVAGGIGITPMRSMIKWLHDHNEKRDLSLLYAVSHADDIAFGPLLHDYLGERFQLCITGNGQQPLTAARIITASSQLPDCLYYLSGPEQMVEALTKELIRQGIASERIVTDYFHGYVA
jgi:ferredoxin-NADP reductase